MLSLAGACTKAELVLVVDGADQFPKKDFTAGWAAGFVVVVEPVEAVSLGVLVKPGKADGVTVVLLVNPPNIEGVLFEETVDVGLVVVRVGSGPNPELAVVLPKIDL